MFEIPSVIKGNQCTWAVASVAQLDAHLTGDQEVPGLIPAGSRQHSFMEIDHEMFSTVILSLPLIQEGQLLVSCEQMCTRTR